MAWIRLVLLYRWWVVGITVAGCVWGLFTLPQLPIDAVPDITNVQVMINTKTGTLSPLQVETLITNPLERELTGIPHVETTRSISKYGLSQLVVIFKDGTSIYWARQQIAERLQVARSVLPQDMTPEMAPISTGLGEVVMMVIEPKPGSPMEQLPASERLMALRTALDTIIRPAIKHRVPGVAEVDSTGGYRQQLAIQLEPNRMAQWGVSVGDVVARLQGLGDAGAGGMMPMPPQQAVVENHPVMRTAAQVLATPLLWSPMGQLVRVSDLATVQMGGAPRLGGATFRGNEAVLGTVLMLAGANSRQVAMDVEQAIQSLAPEWPVAVRVVYSRAVLVDHTIQTVAKNLMEGAVLVVVVLGLVLGNFRAALVVASTIPVAMLWGVVGMNTLGISANLMSLGAIDFGLVVDGSVVMMENIHHHLSRARVAVSEMRRHQMLIRAVGDVMRPVVVGVGVIAVVYAPILLMTGVEGKLFRPMALTVMMVLLGALLYGVTMVPIMAKWATKGAHHSSETKAMRAIREGYRRVLGACFRHPIGVVVVVMMVGVVSIVGWLRLGSDFMPPLNEGDLVVNIRRDPAISIDGAIANQREADRLIESVPGVKWVFSRLGTPESATDPMGPHLSDTFVVLDSQVALSREAKRRVYQAIETRLSTRFPTESVSESQPIEMRFNELLEGSRADVSIQFFGPDLLVLHRLLTESVGYLSGINGVEDVAFDALTAMVMAPVITVSMDATVMAKWGVHRDAINHTLAAGLGGIPVGSLMRDGWRVPIVVTMPSHHLPPIEWLRGLPVALPMGGTVQLGQVARVTRQDQVTTIAHRNGLRYAGVALSLGDRDVNGVVGDAKGVLSRLTIPDGYRVEWGGQYAHMKRANARWLVVIPVTFITIMLGLLITLPSWRDVVAVMGMIPFGVSGGVLGMHVAGIPLTVSAGIGFIALSGIAILNGLVLVTTVHQLQANGRSMQEAAFEAAVSRLRPVLMTAMVAGFGFLPMAFNRGLGAEIQQPLAVVVIGGVLSVTMSTLLLLPVVMGRWRRVRGVSSDQ